MKKNILKRFIKLSTLEKRLLLEAILSLYWIKTLIVLFPFKKIQKFCGFGQNESSFELLSDQEVQQLNESLLRAQRFVLWKKSFCLVNALALQWMFKKRGMSSTLQLGVTKSKENQLMAHAWLECRGLHLIGSKTKDAYSKIASLN